MTEESNELRVSRRSSIKFMGLTSLFAFWPATLRVFSPRVAHAADDSKDLTERLHADILLAIKNEIKRRELKGVTGIGPLQDDGSCLILVKEPQLLKNFPKEIEVSRTDQLSLTIKLTVEIDQVPSTLFLAFTPPPQHAGPLMGGDPIWNNKGSWWGTIAFAALAGSKIKIEGYACDNQCISCNHVLYHAGGDVVSTPNYSNSMKLKWSHPPTGSTFVDLAGAELNSGIPAIELNVRGLQKINGAVQPTDGIRVLKYGATTGLTTGKDLGAAYREVDSVGHAGEYFWIRTVSGDFAEKGDSGAAVLDANRNLVGIVVGGKEGTPDEKYYMPVLPMGETPVNPSLSYFVIESL
jgi:hypothetical protein